MAGKGGHNRAFVLILETLMSSKIVRKEFKTMCDATCNPRPAFEKELHNLSMLRLIKHPNIVELLAAYTFKGKHNLIFRKACDKTLSSLLEHPRPQQFASFGSVLDALSGLCSALDAVHEFKFPDLSFIGCHHDLKPDNVLIDNGSFLLADFGLSSFKDSNEGSDTSFKQVRGDYVAPECQDLEDLSTENRVRRPSDVWSLACIMLEVVTWMAFGPHGVEEFEENRAFKVDHYTRHRFHHGLGSESPAVVAQIDRLALRSVSRPEKKLMRLIWDMLDLDPQKRPSAEVVKVKMQYITIESICRKVQEDLHLVFEKGVSIQAWMALQKFTGWMHVCKVDQHDRSEQWRPEHYPNFQTTKACLVDMENAVITILPECQRSSAYLYEPLHHLNDMLYAALSADMQKQAQAYFRLHTLSTDNKTHLENMAQMSSFPTGQAHFMVLAKVRLLCDLTDNQSLASPELRINPTRLRSEEMNTRGDSFAGRNSCGTLRTKENESISVIVECKQYAHGATEQNLVELVTRLSNITKLLREARAGFRILPCIGFYHNPGEDSCGLVYAFPAWTVNAHKVKFTTLKAGLDNYYRKPLPRLGLESRFRLANELAVSILKFHEAGWLQKNISSFNIGFFHLEKDPWVCAMDKPYFLGYLNSRPNQASAYTEFVEDPRERDYQHPDYLKSRGKVRYQSRFDYYSLGLILLEIGRFESLEHMSTRQGSLEQLRQYLIREKVPRLGQNMGNIYQTAVTHCLSDEFTMLYEGETPTTNDRELHLKFSELVVNQLARCTV